MSTLTDQARQLANTAINFNHPMLPAAARAVVHESARLVYELSQRLEALEKKVAENEQAAKQ